ncbi:MAG: Aminoglycoside 6-adenylyltransferase [Eubacteriales bacterium SKADARSKE-1]|nr:Aminoglycoside 6-adenylyltransferase [Eubacteriales bacterium SKADARSKE-1]
MKIQYGWLIMLEDFNRVDLHVNSINFAKSDILSDKMCKVLLDKDNLFTETPESTDLGYYVKRPTKAEFSCECNEFWWCLNNAAKGLWREEIPYIMDMLNDIIRPNLTNVLSWKIGIENNFSCSTGKSGKYMYQFLPENTWKKFLETYPNSNIEHIWKSVFIMCDLFSETAKKVASKLNFNYNENDEFAARKYLNYVYQAPKK